VRTGALGPRWRDADVDRARHRGMSAIAALPFSTCRLALVPVKAEHADEMAAVLAGRRVNRA
jgi:hypothetical protein